MNLRFLTFSFALLGLLSLWGCSRTEPPRRVEMEILHRLVSLEVSEAEAPQWLFFADSLQSEIKPMGKTLDASDPDSEIRQVNRLAGTIRLPVSRTISQILVLADRVFAASDGAFDLTLEPYLQIWGFRGGPVPDEIPHDLLEAARSILGMKRITRRGDTVSFANEVVSLSVDPVLDGYLTDICTLRLRGNRLRNGMVKVGRGVRVLGSKTPAEPWSISVADPRENRSEPLGRLILGGSKDRSAANSCHALESYVLMKNGQKISWVMDPATGMPARDTLFALVVSSTSFEADALSYALIVRGVKGAPKLLANFPACEALLIPTDHPDQIWMTPGMKEVFQPTASLALTIHDLIREAEATEKKAGMGEEEEASPATADDKKD